MEVCHLINDLALGGAQRLLLDLVRHTDHPDVSYTICYLETDAALADEVEDAGARVVGFDAPLKFDPRAAARFRSVLARGDFDVLHTHLPHASVVGRLVGRSVGLDAVVSTHHNVPANYHPLTRALERATRGLDAVTVAVSSDVQAEFVGGGRQTGHDWRTIYNGIDAEGFRAAVDRSEPPSMDDDLDGGLTFLSVGRYDPQKAQADLVRAMAEPALRDARLFIVGSGRLGPTLDDLVRKLDLEERVAVTGPVPSVHGYYALADAFVLPSIEEGFGITLIEAMAAGLPVVATDIPAVREVVEDGRTGILVPANSPRRLAEAMSRLGDAELRAKYGRAGYERVRERFAIERTVSSHLDLYRELTERG